VLFIALFTVRKHYQQVTD